MSGMISEFFGFPAADSSPEALRAAASMTCPFLGTPCTKILSRDGTRSGVCAIRQKTESTPDVICCPIRLYADNYCLLEKITKEAFGSEIKHYAGRIAVDRARKEGAAVAVFGHRWGGELRLPKRKGSGSYFVELPVFSAQPASIHFMAYDYVNPGQTRNGTVRPLGVVKRHDTTVYKVQEAFSSISLPDANVYQRAIIEALS